jgi:hypothetical protein
MSGVQVACPGCGAPILFRLGSSLVTVCEYCRSVVARGDRNLEDLGKIAFLAETDSPLEIGMKGSFRGHAFEVLGAARLGHEAGGSWDEWYLAFDDDRWGWLAEAQGRFYMTFAVPAKGKEALPEFDALKLDQKIRVRPEEPPLVVSEKGEGRPIGAKGEIPYRLVPGELYQYADLSGPGKRFGTLDYSDVPPSLYLGSEVALDELKLPHKEESYEHLPTEVAAIQVACPQCGGALELRAPDKTERVGCQFCGAMLDASQGKLKLLQAAEGGPVKFPLPIGTKGQLGGVEYIIIGYLRRGVELEGEWYYWSEYLLYNGKAGFRWLECSDNHWSFIEPLPPGSVEFDGSTALYAGKRFRWFQKAEAHVKLVVGEFYWKVAVGEKVLASDFIRPPESLSREVMDYGPDKGELSWSHGTYLPVVEVEKAFGLKKPLPRPSTIGPSQPFPYRGLNPYWAFFAAVVVLVGLFFLMTCRRTKVFEENYVVTPTATADEGRIFFAGPIKIRPRQNVEIQATTDTTNIWLWIDGELVDEKSGVMQGFSLPVEYYAGVEEGEAWSEGSRDACTYLSALPEGEYSLRLEMHGEPKNPTLNVHLRIRQDVPRPLHWFLALLAVSAVPGAIVGYQLSFESRRWSDSNVK